MTVDFNDYFWVSRNHIHTHTRSTIYDIDRNIAKNLNSIEMKAAHFKR